jgi:hypothetical protein
MALGCFYEMTKILSTCTGSISSGIAMHFRATSAGVGAFSAISCPDEHWVHGLYI